jgi:hypothetical protein
MVHPERVHFPGAERTSYTAAAVVLATDRVARSRACAATMTGWPLRSA